MGGCPAETKQSCFTSALHGSDRSGGADTYVEFGEVCEDLCQAVVVVLLGEFHFSHVEVSDSVNLVMLVYHCGRLPLSFG